MTLNPLHHQNFTAEMITSTQVHLGPTTVTVTKITATVILSEFSPIPPSCIASSRPPPPTMFQHMLESAASRREDAPQTTRLQITAPPTELAPPPAATEPMVLHTPPTLPPLANTLTAAAGSRVTENSPPPLPEASPPAQEATTSKPSSSSPAPNAETLIASGRALYQQPTHTPATIRAAQAWLKGYIAYTHASSRTAPTDQAAELTRTYQQLKASLSEPLSANPSKGVDPEYKQELATFQQLVKSLEGTKSESHTNTTSSTSSTTTLTAPLGKGGLTTSGITTPGSAPNANGVIAPLAGIRSPQATALQGSDKRQKGGVEGVKNVNPKETQQIPPPPTSEKSEAKAKQDPRIQIQQHMQDCERELKELLDSREGEALTPLVHLLLYLVDLQNQEIDLWEEEIARAHQGHYAIASEQEAMAQVQHKIKEAYKELDTLLETYYEEQFTPLVQLLLHITKLQTEEISLLSRELSEIRRPASSPPPSASPR